MIRWMIAAANICHEKKAKKMQIEKRFAAPINSINNDVRTAVPQCADRVRQRVKKGENVELELANELTRITRCTRVMFIAQIHNNV